MSQRLQDLERRLQYDPAPFVCAQLADEYCRAGRYDEAIACCQRLLTPHPTYFTARVVLGRALAALGRCEDAAREFEQVLTAAPDHLAATKDLAEVYERLNRPADALRCYRRALELARADTHAQSAIARLSSRGAPGPDPIDGGGAPALPVDFDALLARLGHPNQPVPPLIETLLTQPERLLAKPNPAASTSQSVEAAVRTLERWLAVIERDR